MKRHVTRWLTISVRSLGAMVALGGIGWPSYSIYRADDSFRKFEIFQACMEGEGAQVGTPKCAHVHPKAVLFNRTDPVNLGEMAARGLHDELNRPFPSAKRVAAYYKIIRPEAIINYPRSIRRESKLFTEM